MIFRHKYIHLVYHRERGFHEINYCRKQKKYIPEIMENCCPDCHLNLVDNACPLCCHQYFQDMLNEHES